MQVNLLHAQVPFSPIDTNFITNTIIIPPFPLRYDVLFTGNSDFVFTNGGHDSALAKQMMDYIGILPIGNGKKENWVFTDHEILNTKNSILGDGGGMTLFKIKRFANSGWRTVPSHWDKKYINVDFSAVGGINRSCGGTLTPYGTILLAEEFPAASNAALFAGGSGFSDTSNFIIPAGNGPYSGSVLKRYQQMGWMTEVDPGSASAVRKFYAMGNFSHEDAVCMNDGKTVYLTEDNSPSCLYKFVAEEANNYITGQLYVYSQSEDGETGSWLALPMALDSLLNIRTLAFTHGATMFTRLEGICKNADETKIYFSETGSDVCDYNYPISLGGKMAKQIMYLDTIMGFSADSILNDFYGRVWQFDLATNQCYPLVEGGTASDGKTNFSNPDNVQTVKFGEEKEFLFVQEDLNGISYGRQPAYIFSGSYAVPEMYCLDLSIENPTLDDLRRFALGPKGSETSGVTFNSDGNVLFLNIMHPNGGNPFPFNNSNTLAVTGMRDIVLNEITDDVHEYPDESFFAFPNPADKIIRLNKTTDISLYDAAGKFLYTKTNISTLDVSNLSSGTYFLQTKENELQKLVIH